VVALLLRIWIIRPVSPLNALALSVHIEFRQFYVILRRYVFLYGMHYYMKNVHSSHYVAALLFFGYMAVVSFLFFVLTGVSGDGAMPLRRRSRPHLQVSVALCPLFSSCAPFSGRSSWIERPKLSA
jgi:hypothetical protein